MPSIRLQELVPTLKRFVDHQFSSAFGHATDDQRENLALDQRRGNPAAVDMLLYCHPGIQISLNEVHVRLNPGRAIFHPI